MYKLKIKVTKEHLKIAQHCGTREGGADITTNCAIAVAVQDIFPNASIGCYIYPFSYITEEEDKMRLPKEAGLFISRFDSFRGQPHKRVEMSEFEFSVDVPQSVIDKISINSLKEHETLELIEH